MKAVFNRLRRLEKVSAPDKWERINHEIAERPGKRGGVRAETTPSQSAGNLRRLSPSAPLHTLRSPVQVGLRGSREACCRSRRTGTAVGRAVHLAVGVDSISLIRL
jgi:hypothetical protein